MATIRCAPGGSYTAHILQRRAPRVDLDSALSSTTTSDEASSDLVPFVAGTTSLDGLVNDHTNERHSRLANLGCNSDIFPDGLTAQSAILLPSSPRVRTSVRGIAAGFKEKVGRHLRRLSNEFRGRRGDLAARQAIAANRDRLRDTRYEIPLVSPALAEVSSTTRSNLSSRDSTISDDGLAPSADRVIGEPARVAGVTVLDDGRVTYQPFAPAGEGGFASVFYAHAHPYLAKNESLYPKVVAIKVFNRRRLADREISIRHVGDECKALQHATRSPSPFLTRLISTFYDDRHIYAVMHAYVGTLADRLCDTNRRMPAHEIKQLASELIVGVQAVHGMSYIHRDLKAENVFLSPAGHLVIGDFTTVINPARRKRPGSKDWLSERIRAESQPVGTPLRYAPEQLSAEFYTSKVDLWAIGLMMFELFRGNCTDVVFCPSERDEHPGSVEILTKNLRPEIDLYVDEVQARRLVRRLLSRDPETRPSIRQMMRDSYFIPSGREQDVEEYWGKIERGDNPAFYPPPKIVAPKTSKLDLFFRTPEREPPQAPEVGFDPTYPAYHYECDESLLILDENVYGRLAVVEV
ncbi:unnamed protein product [Peniophora sp. CBMAI 1063]|nr:unnamed protein product [Peniophora sp. CBMAI 1063]